MFKTTTGFTVILILSFTSVSFSSHVTLTLLVKVPLVNVFIVIVNMYDSPASIKGISNIPVALSYPVTLDSMNSNP